MGRASVAWTLAGWLALGAEPSPAEAPSRLDPLEVRASDQALPTDVERLPSSSTVIDETALHRGQYQLNLSETLAQVPGLVANNRHNYAQDLQLSLRGFGARATFGVRGIRLYTDGIPATMPDGQGQISHFDLTTAERLTVLRGPFSALYGSASGGVIELLTRAPAQSSFELSAWDAAWNSRRYALAGASAHGRYGLIGAATLFDTDGYRVHSAAERRTVHARGHGHLGPDDQVVLLGSHVHLEALDPLGLTAEQVQADRRQAGNNALAYNTRKTVQQAQFGAGWTHRLEGSGDRLRLTPWVGRRDVVQFLSIPDVVQGTADSNPSHPGGVIDLERLYYGADLRWIRDAELAERALRLSAGLDLQFLDEDRRGYQNYVGDPGDSNNTKGVRGPLRRDETNRVASYDPYAQAEWRFAEEWLALVGLRHSHTRFETEDHYVRTGNGDDSGEVRFDALLATIGLRQSLGSRLSWHAAVSRGSETPTLNELAYRPDGSAGLNRELEAARSLHHELGLRARPITELEAELVVFRIDTQDEITVAASSGGRSSFHNASATTREGFEASLRWRPHRAWSMQAAFTRMDAVYDRGFCPGSGCTEDNDVDAGSRLPGVPRHQLYTEVAWTPLGGSLHAAVEALRRGNVTVNDRGSALADGFTVFNLRLGWHLPFGPGRPELFARADNLLDRAYVGSVIVNEAQGRYFEPAPERSLGAGLRWIWGG